jgi:hypothetical protein
MIIYYYIISCHKGITKRQPIYVSTYNKGAINKSELRLCCLIKADALYTHLLSIAMPLLLTVLLGIYTV